MIMKRALLRFLFAAVLACGFLFAQDIRAQSFEVDGAMYTATSATTCSTEQYSKNIVTNNEAYSGDYVIPEKVVHDGVTYTVTAIGDETFHDCVDLTSVSIPSTVTYIGKEAFMKCVLLDNVVIPESVTEVGAGAFQQCSNLKEVSIQAKLNMLSERMFRYCSSLKSIEIPSSVTVIGGSAFMFSGLESVAIPETVLHIQSSAFSNCNGLTSIVVPNSVTLLGDNAFAGCGNLSSVTLSTSLKAIELATFSGCTSLEAIEIPYGVTTLGEHVFWGCINLKMVKLPETLTTIGSRAFYECTSLEALELPRSVTSIGESCLSETNLFSFSFVDATHSTAKYYYTCGITGVERYVGLYGGRYFDAGNGSVVFTGLTPGKENFVSSGFMYGGGKYCGLAGDYVMTDAIDIDVSYEILSPMEAVFHGEYDAGDAEVTATGFRLTLSSITTPFFTAEGDMLTYTDFEPDKGYAVEYYIVANGTEFKSRKSFLMPEVEFTTLPAEAISNTVARICADTNLPDGTEGTGFEWRRYDAPDEMPSSTAECPVIDGKLTGTLNNLSQSTYYKFRPYYTSENGKTQYGEWVAFITADAYVYFEPTVRTYEAADITETTAAVSAAAVQGSDAITEQGFEYWPTATRSAAMRMEAAAPQGVQTVTALGQVMTATLEGLQPGTGYTFRAYAKTAKGTTYGNELTFTTQNSSGIQSVPITGGAVETARYDAAGRKVSSPVRGLNIVVMSDGSVRKEIVR